MVVTVSADRIGIQCRCDQPFKLLERRWTLDPRASAIFFSICARVSSAAESRGGDDNTNTAASKDR